MDTDGKHKIYVSYFMRNGWQCQFLEADCRTSVGRPLTFKTPDKVRELVERGGGLVDSEAKNMLEMGLSQGRGGAYLYLDEKQYAKLRRD